MSIRHPLISKLRLALIAVALTLCCLSPVSRAAANRDARPPDSTAAHHGLTLYVSKLGDNSDGSSWRRAFHTIQAALNAIPDDKGGYRIIVRPDTYAEANLYPAHKGAKGAYNLLEGDWDGTLGSGATGWVVIDAGAPLKIVRTNPKAPGGNPTFMILKKGDPWKETGLKSVDWWGPFRCDPSFSGVAWDRWEFKNLYAAGSEGGIGWDMTCQAGCPFSAVVEHCVGIGRFAGACVMGHVNRPKEPVVFRDSFFMCLDVWGDAGGVYVRAHNHVMPATPDAIFENCTLVGGDNAIQIGYPGFEGYTRVRLDKCRLIVLNFSQPHGTPSTGVIYSDLAGKYFHVDLDDCTIAGYKVFGARNNDMFSYTTTGTNRAYVQYRQSVPVGFQRLRFWPLDVFNELTPARFVATGLHPPGRPRLVKLPFAIHNAMENTPVIFDSRPLLLLNHREDKSMYLYILDLRTGAEIARFGAGFSFVSGFVKGPVLHVYASRSATNDWFHDIYHFWSTDLTNWNCKLAIPRARGEHLFNSSVCAGPHGYLMAYESEKPVQFCFKFARSEDLSHWKKIPGLVFTGVNHEYSACPVIRYFAPYYYVIYLHAAIPGHNGWVPFMARSRDLKTWELSPFNPILEASAGEGINNSDVDLFEYHGSTFVYYATGDQQTWGDVRVAEFHGPMKAFFSGYFPDGVPMIRATAAGEQ